MYIIQFTKYNLNIYLPIFIGVPDEDELYNMEDTIYEFEMNCEAKFDYLYFNI